MPATPARIAKFTVDGIVLSKVDTALRTANPNAIDRGGDEIEMFFDNEADAQALLDERWNWLKTAGRIHEAVEFDVSTAPAITVTPAVPSFTVSDPTRKIVDVQAKVKAIVSDFASERQGVELFG